VGSAVGFLRAPIAYDIVRSRYMRLKGFDPALANDVLDAMLAEATEVVRQGTREAQLEERRQAFMRYVGQGHEIAVPLPNRPFQAGDVEMLRQAFEREYAVAFQRIIPNAEIEVMTWALSVSVPVDEPAVIAETSGRGTATPAYVRRLFDPAVEDYGDAPIYARGDLGPGAVLSGPAIIVEDETSTVVTAAFDARINAKGYIVLQRR
jgi:N-methylhydantoinase A